MHNVLICFVIQVVVNALGNLGGEFSGKYYPLSKMTNEEQEQLINVRERNQIYHSNINLGSFLV